jgi:PPIC-type PPIASE domain
VSDDDVKKYFDDPKNKPALTLDARRKVKYIVLSLSDDEKKLPPAEKRQALQKIADQMEALSGAMMESGANFDKIAAGLGLADKVKETPEFDRESITKLSEANVQGFMQSALALTPENPASDVLQGAETFHFLVLSSYTPARALTLEEARPQIVQVLQEERGRLALEAKANEARAQVAQALKDGKTFAEAAAAAGLKAETFPAFSRTEPNFEFADSQQVIQGTFNLAAGECSKPLSTGEGADLVYVVKRVPPEAEKFEAARDALANNLRMFKQTIAARQWLFAGREAAGLQVRGGDRELRD